MDGGMDLLRMLPVGTPKNAKFNKLHRSTERDSMLTHYFALFGGLRLRFGYSATYGAKSELHSCSATPISYKGDEISRVSHVVSDI